MEPKKLSYITAITCPYCGGQAGIKVSITDCSMQFLHKSPHCSPRKNPAEVMKACGKTLKDLVPPDVFKHLRLTGSPGYPSDN